MSKMKTATKFINKTIRLDRYDMDFVVDSVDLVKTFYSLTDKELQAVSKGKMKTEVVYVADTKKPVVLCFKGFFIQDEKKGEQICIKVPNRVSKVKIV